MSTRIIPAVLLVAGVCFIGASPAAAQDSSVMMPDESAAKAKQLLQQAIAALGGPAYLNVRDVACTGHVGQFDSQGFSAGYIETNDFRRLPDKARIEYIGKGRHTILQYLAGIGGLEFSSGGIVITLFNGDRGWSYDRGGVNELPADSVSEFRERAREGIGNLLRFRLNEPGALFRYAGRDIVDLKEAEWVEFVDAGDRAVRIAFANDTHLPIRKTIETTIPNTQAKATETEYYSNYHSIGGVETAFQVTRERNGFRILQLFFDKCDINTGLPDSLFTKSSLDELWAKSGKKAEKKDKDYR